MKSRKMRAVLAAVSAIAVLATAMTGFAATVTTTTTYNTNDNYVYVTSTVTGANGEVTYLATTEAGAGVAQSGIIYIDQKTADGASVDFNYRVTRSDISNLVTDIALGTSGTVAIDQPENGLGIVALDDVTEPTYTITFDQDAYANGDATVSAAIDPVDGYEIMSVTINGVAQEPASSYSVPVIDGAIAAIVVETSEVSTDPEVESNVVEAQDVEDGKFGAAIVLKPSGNYTEVGVRYDGYEFPATGTANGAGYVAVQIIDGEEVDASQLTPYIK